MATAAIMSLCAATAQTNDAQERAEVLLETTEGNIRMALYNEMPRHRDNFLKQVGEHSMTRCSSIVLFPTS